MRAPYSLLVAASFALVSAAPSYDRPLEVRVASDTTLHIANGVLYANGVRFTGLVVDPSGSGVERAEVTYRDGLRDGDELAWYPNGQLMHRRRYARGREDGEHLGWWQDGTRHFVYHFSNGLLEGEAREWFPNGTPFRVFHYAAGQEAGAQTMWYANGALRANYVVRNGRRFGLPGSKGCTGMDSSESSR